MAGRRNVGRPGRMVLALLVSAVAAVSLAAAVDAAPRSKGTLYVFDSSDCTGNGNAPRVTVPFSVGGRNYPPNIDMSVYATDMATGERFGPFIVATNDDGAFCALVRQARPTRWKIDLVEPGSGFTDSKVITVLPPPSPPDPTSTTATPTTPAPTTTAAVTTTTAAVTTSTGQGATTTGAPTTSAAPTTTAAVTTTTLDAESSPPIDFEPVPVPPEWSLPSTGSGPATPATWGAAFMLAGALLLAVARRRGAPDSAR